MVTLRTLRERDPWPISVFMWCTSPGRPGILVFYVLHNSEDLTTNQFSHVITGVKRLHCGLKVNASTTRLYFGVATFSDTAVITQDPFDANRDGLFKHIHALAKQGTGTNIEKAIICVSEYVVKTRWQRPRDLSPPMIFLITGDVPDNIQTARMESLKAQTEGMVVVVLGLENVESSAYLDIASRPEYINVLDTGQAVDIVAQDTLHALRTHEPQLFSKTVIPSPFYDVVFVLSNSQTMNKRTFQDMKLITSQLITNFRHTNHSDDTSLSVGLMTYSDRPRLVRRLTVMGNMYGVLQEVDNIDQTGTGGDLEGALGLLDGMFGWYTGNHLQRPNLGVVFVSNDSDFDNRTLLTADQVRSHGVPLMAIGLGDVSGDKLAQIASNDNVVFHHSDDTHVIETVVHVTDAFRKGAVLPGLDSCSMLYLDLAFIVDVEPKHLPYLVDSLTDRLITIDARSVRISLVTLDPDPTVQRSFRSIGSRQRLRNIKSILKALDVQINESVNITDIMIFLREDVFSRHNHDRPKVQNVAMFITDRVRNRSEGVDDALRETRDAGIHMIVVGIGLEYSAVQWMASDPRGALLVPTVTSLSDVMKTAHHLLCPGVCSRSSVHYNGLCYEFDTGSPLSWQTGKKRCFDRGQTLPVITSPDIEDFIRATFFYWSGSFFLGLRKMSLRWYVSKGRFVWQDGKPLVHSNWARNSTGGVVNQQPNGGFLELCHLSEVDGWHDIGCAKVTPDQNVVLCTAEAGTHTTHMQVPRIPEVTVSVSSKNISDINGLVISDYKLAYTYTCRNGELTARHFRCNGVADCSDKSDEQNCRDISSADEVCSEDQFTCDNGRCVSYNLCCDYWDDCGDNSDEHRCVRDSCASGFTKCDNGQCVHAHARCDLIADCADRSDEEKCDTCSAAQATCYDGTCIPRMWVGDGITDCAGIEQEDETELGRLNDEAVDKQLLWWHTPSSTFVDNRCLLVPDRYGRYVLFQGVVRTREPTHRDYQNCANSTCSPGEYKCPDSYCILSSNVCDGKQDCPHGQDEYNCHELYCPTYFRCRDSTTCLHPAQVCDRRVDCPLADDERLCSDRCGPNPHCREGIVTVEYGMRPSQVILHTVTKLDISRTGITPLALNISEPLYMVNINMSKCSFTGIGKKLESLVNLVEADLSYNQFKLVTTRNFKRNRRLKVLHLSYNTLLVEINPKAFQHNVKLEELYLNNCHIKHLLTHMFYGLSALVYLDLSYNYITHIDDYAFDTLGFLKTLKLKGNPISKFSADVFSGLSSLELLTADKYILCCDIVKPATVSPANCETPRNSLSSCEDLMQNDVLRVFIWVLGVMALVGNVLVFLYRVVYDRKFLRRAYGCFLLCLSVSDFVMGVYLMIIANADLQFRGSYIWHDSAWRSSGMCKAAGFLSTLSSEASAIFICLVTFDRLLAIKYPFRQISLSRKSMIITSGIAWVLAITMAMIPLLPWTAIWQLYGHNGACLPLPLTSERLQGWQYSTAVFIGFNLVTFVLIAIGQYLIYRYMREGSLLNTQERRAQEMGVARKLSLVVISDFLCWFPVCIMGLLALNGTQISGEVYAWAAVFVLPVNSAINPILYTIPSIIQTIRDLCAGPSVPKRKQHVTPTTSYTPRGSEDDASTGLSQL